MHRFYLINDIKNIHFALNRCICLFNDQLNCHGAKKKPSSTFSNKHLVTAKLCSQLSVNSVPKKNRICRNCQWEFYAMNFSFTAFTGWSAFFKRLQPGISVSWLVIHWYLLLRQISFESIFSYPIVVFKNTMGIALQKREKNKHLYSMQQQQQKIIE